jgi:hypothetical protein
VKLQSVGAAPVINLAPRLNVKSLDYPCLRLLIAFVLDVDQTIPDCA